MFLQKPQPLFLGLAGLGCMSSESIFGASSLLHLRVWVEVSMSMPCLKPSAFQAGTDSSPEPGLVRVRGVPTHL